ncbi:MAG: N-acetyl sugar amidotransferase [Candidatus Nanoarchaeia archaeon]|nr:N-acetyl sugar amidotransferase [Candidatus Nanoarchaeia archaeon]
MKMNMNVNIKLPSLDIDTEKYNNYEFKPMDAQLSKVPKEIKLCKKCIMPNTRPRIEFDEEGVCNACRYAEKKFHGGIDWDAREKELKELLDKHRSKDGSFDCLVPGSGGKDSVFVAEELKKYGMHPLLVTWGPFMWAPIGYQNYINWIQAGNDGLVLFQNGILHRKLSRIGFELLGDNFEPFTYGQKAFVFHVALRFKIPLIFYGENGEVEYGGSTKNQNKPYESVEDWQNFYYKGNTFDNLLNEGVKMGILKEEEIENHNFDFYKTPPIEEIKKLGIQMHWFSYYKKWNPLENYSYAQKATGFEAAPERTEGTYNSYCSIDDETDPFHWYLGFIKYGYGRCTREACSEIRSGDMTREEALQLAKKYDAEFPEKAFKGFLEYLDMTEEHFWEVIDRYRLPHIWKKEDGEWKLRHPVWEIEQGKKE